jgi:hypothetical protein
MPNVVANAFITMIGLIGTFVTIGYGIVIIMGFAFAVNNPCPAILVDPNGIMSPSVWLIVNGSVAIGLHVLGPLFIWLFTRLDYAGHGSGRQSRAERLAAGFKNWFPEETRRFFRGQSSYTATAFAIVTCAFLFSWFIVGWVVQFRDAPMCYYNDYVVAKILVANCIFDFLFVFPNYWIVMHNFLT